MQDHRLPSGLVALLNALYHQSPYDDFALEQAYGDVSQLEKWYSMESGFWIDAEEQAQLSSLRQHLDQLSHGLERLHWPTIQANLSAADGLMEGINQRRGRAPYSSLPALHHCILAGGAVIIGQGRWDCLAARWQLAEAYIDNLDLAFDSLIAGLEDPLQQSIQVGFDKAQEAIKLGRSAVEMEDAGDLREALQRLKDAGEVLEFLPRTHQQIHLDLAKSNTRFKIPLVGPRLEQDLKCPQQIPVETRLQETLPVLTEYLTQEGPGVLMLPEDHCLWNEVEECLEAVRAAYTDHDARLSQRLEDLSQAFAEIERVRLKPETLTSPLAQRCAAACQSVLRGHWPDLALVPLVEELRALPAWQEVADHLQAYLVQGEPDGLHRAAFATQEAAQTAASVSFLAE